MKKIRKLIKICNKNRYKKYYKIMKKYKKFLGMPKMCSNYTSKSENSLKIDKHTKYTIIIHFSGNIKIYTTF